MLEIRSAQRPRDKKTIERLWLSYLEWGNREMQARHGAHPHSPREAVAQDMIAIAKFPAPDGCIILACMQGKARGIGCLRRIGPAVGEIERMYVDPAYRRIGAGRAILQRLRATAARSGYAHIRLESHFMTAAHGLCRSLGFTDIEPNAESEIQDSFEPYMVFMERDV